MYTHHKYEQYSNSSTCNIMEGSRWPRQDHTFCTGGLILLLLPQQNPWELATSANHHIGSAFTSNTASPGLDHLFIHSSSTNCISLVVPPKSSSYEYWREREKDLIYLYHFPLILRTKILWSVLSQRAMCHLCKDTPAGSSTQCKSASLAGLNWPFDLARPECTS